MHPRFEKSLVPEQYDDGWTSFHWFGLILMAAFALIWVAIYSWIMAKVGDTAP